MKQYLRVREKEAKVSTVTGIVLTVAIHLVILLSCAFTGLKYLYPPPQEQTFLIDFSEDEPAPVPRQAIGRQPQAEEVDITKPVELIQRSESPVKSDRTNKTAEAKPDSHGDVEVPAPKEEINKNALFPGMSKKDSSLAPHGATNPSAEFKAGHPKGNTTTGKTDGVPNAHLKGRSVLGALPRPDYAVQDEGKVVGKRNKGYSRSARHYSHQPVTMGSRQGSGNESAFQPERRCSGTSTRNNNLYFQA